MKALLLAATSSLALTGFAMAQTAVTTDPPAENAVENAATATGNAAQAVGDKAEDVADKAENAADRAGNAVDESVTTGTSDTAEDAADRAEDAADAAEDSADAAVTAGSGTAATGTMATTTTTGTAPASDAAMGAAGTDSATTTTTTESTTVTAASTDGAAAMTADHPGMLGSWIMKRRIWTTNQPSSTEWSNTNLTERPAEWTDIAKIDDIVVDAQGNITGYVADIGGFLGLGAKQVLLNKDALHFVQIGDDAFFATNFTREELEALPDFDTTTVMR